MNDAFTSHHNHISPYVYGGKFWGGGTGLNQIWIMEKAVKKPVFRLKNVFSGKCMGKYKKFRSCIPFSLFWVMHEKVFKFLPVQVNKKLR